MRKAAHAYRESGCKCISVLILLTSLLAVLLSPLHRACAQDAVGSLEGHIADKSNAVVSGATVHLQNLATNAVRTQNSDRDGLYRFVQLGVGVYSLSADAPGFAHFSQAPIEITVSETTTIDVALAIGPVTQSVIISDVPAPIDTASNTLGKVVGGREVLDLPLNGRNFAQLGLLQTGVAPISSGVLTEGGSLRQGQSYAVNGQRPEGNNFLLDGAQNVNRMDGGYALKIPIDAIAEFRILTNTAPPEYGGNTGSTTSVVTRSGSNDLHGTVYEFFRNDALDTRNYFAPEIQPLKQNQFGVTAGGPLRKDRLFAFAYYEGFRNRQGITTSATVPTQAEQQGDFSGLGYPLINYAAGGVPFPGNKIPARAINPVSANVAKLYPAGNSSADVYTATVVGTNDDDQTGLRLDYHQNDKSQFFTRYSWFTGYNINPVSVRGSDLPGLSHAGRFHGGFLCRGAHAAGELPHHQFLRRVLLPLCVPVRPAAEQDSAQRPGLRLPARFGHRGRAALLQPGRLFARGRSYYRPTDFNPKHLRAA